MLNRKFVVRLTLSLLVSALLIFLSLRNTDLSAIGAAIARADPWPVLGYAAILLLAHLIKTLRWWLLLVPLGPTGFRRVNAASAVGFMLMVLMPLRLGELGRPLIVSRPSREGELPLRRSAALASCVVERVIDLLAVSVLGIISLHLLAATGHSAELAQHAATIVTAGVGVVCVGMVFAYFLRLQTVRLIERLLTPISGGLAQRVSRLVDGFILGLQVGSFWSLLAFLALTATFWAMHVLGFWMVAGAFGLQITPLMACTVLASQVVGIMIPAGPGMVGTSQFFTQLGLSIFIPGALTVPSVASRAAAYANTIWLLQFGQQVLTGLPFVIGGRVSLQGLFERREPDAALSPENGV